MPHRDELQRRIEQILQRAEDLPEQMKTLLKDVHPGDVAETLSRFPREEQIRIFAAMPPDIAGAVLEELDEPDQFTLVTSVNEEKLADIIDEMAPDESADVLDLLTDEEQEDVREIKELLSYPEDSAGGIMTTKVLSVPETATVDDALREIRNDPDVESVACVFVTDSDDMLKGVLTFRMLVTAKPGTPVRDVMDKDVISVRIDDDQEDVAGIVRKYNFVAVPVVDERHRLRGVVTVDDVLDVLEEEASEDMYKMAGTAARHPTKEGVLSRVGYRLPFLATTLLGGLVTANILLAFRHTTQTVIILVSFIPVMAGTAGNVGVQSATIVVRGLALGEIDTSRVLRVLRGELGVGILLGIACGAVTGLVAAIIDANAMLGAVVTASMIAGITVAATAGTLVPLGLNKVGVDPAIAAGPFISTLNDITGLTIYLGLATMLLPFLAASA